MLLLFVGFSPGPTGATLVIFGGPVLGFAFALNLNAIGLNALNFFFGAAFGTTFFFFGAGFGGAFFGFGGAAFGFGGAGLVRWPSLPRSPPSAVRCLLGGTSEMPSGPQASCSLRGVPSAAPRAQEGATRSTSCTVSTNK